MTNALESGGRASTIHRSPNRRDQRPRLLLHLDPERLDLGAMAIIRAIKEHRRRYGCGSYLFIDPSLAVYVVTEEQSIVQQWIQSKFETLVGLYCPVAHQRGLCAPSGVPDGLTATFDGVMEDIVDHIRTVRA